MTETDAYNEGYNLGLNVGAKKKVEELRKKILKLKINLLRDRDALIYNIAIKEVLELIK